jgi:putative heme-binding domain-containing protein
MIRVPRILCCLCATAIASAADLPVRDGLVWWFDASAQARQRQAAALPPILNGQAADLWLETSDPQRQAAQLLPERRPVFMGDESAAFFRFDGKDDFFAIAGPRRLVPAVTIFILAAPKSNPGNFSAFMATSETGKNDYTSGLNIDQGPAAAKDLSVINVESGGATGFQDLMVPTLMGVAERPFGGFHVFTIRSKIGKNGTEFFFDGIKAGERDRLESMIGLDQLTIGARRYSNDPTQSPFVQGFFAGDIADVVLFDRALSDADRIKVEQMFLEGTAGLHALASGAKGHALETLSNPPVVQMLVPGFTVEELPLRIGNLNNIRYRHDGKLIGLGYDGRIHVLTDTNGDGLEDKDELFWDQTTMRGPIGMALTPKGDPRGDGVFVGSKGKVSLFADRNGDGKADEEKVIATGWGESFHGVDTVGLALDPKDGSIFFGLGCANFADAYLIDKNTGRANYDINSPHGTIQHLSADFSNRETICTGVRFTCSLAFNREGDLFASEQEGATWLPNGNPFDELLQIERGKHYGFPPRHPKHLPNVIDEPAVFEYAPQHQSTVGMVFNESVNGGPAVGPAHWAGDAIVCGESRGKIWRTKLVKTPEGYVAKNYLIACLQLLTVDACVTPQGDLLVACHSGPPDWGTGPAGEGRLFKIRYTGKTLPQPVMAWAAGSDEFRVAFDRPLDPNDWTKAAEKIRVEAGTYVSAGDRYETVRPGYQVVRDQMATPRRWVDVLGVSLSNDQRALVLRVAQQTEATNYAITLPLPDRWKQPAKGIAQQPEMDVALTLNGVAAEVRKADGTELRSVLPHPSLTVSKAFTTGSAEHEAFLAAAMANGSTLTLRGLVDPSNPFVPAIQPGSKLDWDQSADPFSTGLFKVRASTNGKGEWAYDAKAGSRLKPFEPLVSKLVNETFGRVVLENGDHRHVLSPQRIYVPWASDAPATQKGGATVETRTDVKGDWMNGRRLFFGQAACFTCHTIRGEGMALGPDLSNLVHRDRDSVLQDILQPSATINPDQAGSLVKMKDGANVTGIVRTSLGETVTVAMPGGAKVDLPRAKVTGIEPLKNSLMPEDFGKRLNREQQEDLLTFLLVSPLEPAPLVRIDPPPPPPRSQAELAAILPAAPPPDARPDRKLLRILLSSGVKDHGVDEHDYPLWVRRWSKLLSLASKVSVDTCQGFPSEEKLAAADVTVFYSNNAGWNPDAAALLDTYQKRGGGLVYLHWGIEGGAHAAPLAERVGLAFSFSKFRHGPLDLVFSDRNHPITRGFEKLSFLDESYWALKGDPKRIAVLASSMEEQAPQPQLWTMEREQGRVFGCIPGHYTWTFDDPLYRLLVLRGICWVAKEKDVERLSELAVIGARTGG